MKSGTSNFMPPSFMPILPNDGRGNFLIYVTKNSNYCLKIDEFFNEYSNMSVHKCPGHRDRLVAGGYSSEYKCKIVGCKNKRYFRCINGILPSNSGRMQSSCQYGLCKKHGRRNPEHQGVHVGAEDDPNDDPDFENYVTYTIPEGTNDQPTMDINEEEQPILSTTAGRLSARTDYNCRVSGQFLLNTFLKVFIRSQTQATPAIKWAQLFSTIKAKLPGDQYALIQP